MSTNTDGIIVEQLADVQNCCNELSQSWSIVSPIYTHLLVRREGVEGPNEVSDDFRRSQLLHKNTEIHSRRSSHHWRIVAAQAKEKAPEILFFFFG